MGSVYNNDLQLCHPLFIHFKGSQIIVYRLPSGGKLVPWSYNYVLHNMFLIFFLQFIDFRNRQNILFSCLQITDCYHLVCPIAGDHQMHPAPDTYRKQNLPICFYCVDNQLMVFVYLQTWQSHQQLTLYYSFVCTIRVHQTLIQARLA